MLLTILFILFLVIATLLAFFKIFGLVILKLMAIGLCLVVVPLVFVLLLFGIIII